MKKMNIYILIIVLIAIITTGLVLNDKKPLDVSTDVISNNNDTIINTTEKVVEKNDILTIRVSMDDSGLIKSMALSIKFDEKMFELIDGKWINHNAILSDFNKNNLDAAIAFSDEENFYGEIFEFCIKAKEDLKFTLDEIHVDPILKNGIDDIACKGILLTIV